MHGTEAPSAWVQRWSHLVPAGGSVLDVACGHGRHLRWFAQRGHPVTGVDRDPEAIAAIAGTMRSSVSRRRLLQAAGIGSAAMVAAAQSETELAKAFRNEFIARNRDATRALLERCIDHPELLVTWQDSGWLAQAIARQLASAQEVHHG